ncbi:MAG: DUF3108 domain-containing protein, partial [Chthoniobacterales bacterium]
MTARADLRGVAAILLALLVAGPLQAGWREEVRGLRAGAFPLLPDLTARYVFGWSGIEAAEADVTLRRGPSGIFTGTVRGGTKGAARTLYKIDADYRTEVGAGDFRSRGFTLIENYRRYRVEEKVEFPPGGARAWRETTRKGAKPPKWKNFYVPGLRDMAGAVLLARSQPLRDGDRLRLAVFPGDWMYAVTLKVERREKIAWRGQKRKAIRVALEIDRINKDYSLTPHKKFHHGTIWVSDDALRLPLRIEVKVFVGHVFA